MELKAGVDKQYRRKQFFFRTLQTDYRGRIVETREEEKEEIAGKSKMKNCQHKCEGFSNRKKV